MILFPNISPEIFSIHIGSFEFALRWYALSYIFGFIIALFLMKYSLRRRYLWANSEPPMTEDQADSILTYLIIGVIIGGRIGYVLFYNFDFYLSKPVEIVKIWDGGMSFHGGFLGVIMAVLIYCYINKLDTWSVADMIALSTPPGLMLGRLANFINAELWGRETAMPWGVVFPGDRAQACTYSRESLCARHPTQLYEALFEGLILFMILFVLVRAGALCRSKLITGSFFLGYGISRFFVEFFRVPDPQFFSNDNPYGFAYSIGSHGVTMGQALSIPIVFVGVILFSQSFKSLPETKRS